MVLDLIFLGIQAVLCLAGFILCIRYLIKSAKQKEVEQDRPPSFPESFTDSCDTVYKDVWGTHVGYSRTESDGSRTYFDVFGTQVGSSEDF